MTLEKVPLSEIDFVFLDGGHSFMTLIEGIIRRPLTIKMRLAIQQVGMLLIFMLMITVIVNDIGRLLGN